MDVNKIRALQSILGVDDDGVWGPHTQAAMDDLIRGVETDQDAGWHETTATSFADEADVRAFNKCKAEGKTDHQCFAVGDNAIGLWGDSTAEGSGPCCALPTAAWHDFNHLARNKPVIVEANGQTAQVALRDTSGTRDVIDLNPDACKLLGLTPPVKEPAKWRWA